MKKVNLLEENLDEKEEIKEIEREEKVPDEKEENDDDLDKSDDDRDKDDDNDNKESDVDMEKGEKSHNSPSDKSLGDEKLVSEYEQFMKMVASDSPSKSASTSSKLSSKVTSTGGTSPSNYDEFNLEMELSNSKDYKFIEQVSAEHTPERKLEPENKLKKDSVEIPTEVILDQCNDIISEIENPDEDEEDAETVKKDIEENQDLDSRSIPSDWENITIKVEQLSDENEEEKKVKKIRKKKKVRERSYSTSSESSSSSSSSDSEAKSRKRKKRKKISKSSSDSDSSDSSSSDSSSSDEARKKRKKRGRKKKRVKKASRKVKKKRSKKRSDSSSSDSEDSRKVKKRLRRKKLKKKVVEEKEEVSQKTKRKSSTRSLSEDRKLKRSHIEKDPTESKKKRRKRNEKAKRIKLSNELEKQILAKALSPDSVLLKECDTGKEQNLIQEQARQQKKRKREVSEERLSEWEKESILMTKQIEGILDQSMSLDDSTEREEIEKEEIIERKVKEKEGKIILEEKEKGKVVIPFAEKTEIHEDFESSGIPLTIELPLKQVEESGKKEKEKSISIEFLADWERESQRISKVLKEEPTDFDYLNVPSLTQLEQEVRIRDTLTDEWEVDSLDAIQESTSGKKRSSKKKEKVKYDEKTDTYITVQKEILKENKKKLERLSAVRIWEEEQEEGEKEMLLLKKKSKHRKEDWNTDEEFSKMRADKTIVEINTDNLLQSNLNDEKNKNFIEILEVSEDEKSPQKIEIQEKRRKKSRWDVGTQPDEEKDDINMTPVMWEEENADWKTSSTDATLLHLTKVKEQICSSPVLNTLPGKIKLEDFSIAEASSANFKVMDSPDVFQRKLQKIGFSESDWLTESLDQTVPLAFKEKSVVSTSSKEEAKGTLKLKSIAELQDQKMENKVLYSPSSPALSQRSEVSNILILLIKIS